MGRDRSTIYRELWAIARIRMAATGRFVLRKLQTDDGVGAGSTASSQRGCGAWFEDLLRADLSPEQVSGRLARWHLLWISHETIYRHIWRNRRSSGDLWRRLRRRPKYRKRYGTYQKRQPLGW